MFGPEKIVPGFEDAGQGRNQDRDHGVSGKACMSMWRCCFGIRALIEERMQLARRVWGHWSFRDILGIVNERIVELLHEGERLFSYIDQLMPYFQ